VFADVHDPHTVVTLNAEGVYKFQLTADDSELQSSASVTITGVQADHFDLNWLSDCIGRHARPDHGAMEPTQRTNFGSL
jgi:hypothetical protein